MSNEALIARIFAGREEWVELQPAMDGGNDQPAKAALRVKVRRPPESDLPAMAGGFSAKVAAAACVDWEGFTEADLVGEAHGGTNKVPFSVDVWESVALDRTDWLKLVANKLVDMVKAHVAKRGLAAKN